MAVQTARPLTVEDEAAQCRTLETEALLQRLVERIERVAAPDSTKVLRRTPDVLEEIIFEGEMDGARYLLVRSRRLAISSISLSPRELAIARLIAKGLPNKTIGTILEISPWTVATHLRRVFMKLEVTSRAAMVAKLVDESLL